MAKLLYSPSLRGASLNYFLVVDHVFRTFGAAMAHQWVFHCLSPLNRLISVAGPGILASNRVCSSDAGEPMVASEADDESHAIALSSGLSCVEFVFNDDEIVRLLNAAIKREGGVKSHLQNITALIVLT